MPETTEDAEAHTATSNDPKHQQRDDPRYTPSAGCAIFIAGIVILGSVILGGLWTGIQQDRDIGKFASDEREELPSEPGTPEQVKATRGKLADFKKTIRAGEPATLTLTTSDINILIHNETALIEIREIIYIESITEEIISGQTSWPLRRLNPFKPNRYINGGITLKLEASPGKLFLRLDNFDVPGKDIPAGFIERIAQDDLLDTYKNEDNEYIYETIQSATMGDGFVTIESKPVEKKDK